MVPETLKNLSEDSRTKISQNQKKWLWLLAPRSIKATQSSRSNKSKILLTV